MGQITTVGLDIAKSVFQVHGVDATGEVVLKRQLTRARGNSYLRQLLVVGAMAVIRYAERHGTRRPWLVQLMARRTTKIAAVALANKTARMVWAIMTSGQPYREPELRVA